MNNTPENLLVLDTTEHTRLHLAMRINPELDQRAWLAEKGVAFIDLSLLGGEQT